MPRIPKEPQEIFKEFVRDYQETFGNDLVSIVLYGSGARGEYIPKISDLNFLIILTEEAKRHLACAFKLVTKWHKKMVTTPLFLTRADITTSLDSFPIEFLSLKSNYQLLYGEDVLKDISIREGDLRLQCERELKGKLIQLRRGFLESAGRKDWIEQLIMKSLPAFFSIFYSMIYLKEGNIIWEKRTIIEQMGKFFGLDKEFFFTLYEIKERKRKFKGNQEALQIMEHYLTEIERLINYIDREG